MNKRWKSIAKIVIIILGNAAVALGVAGFILAHEFVIGGTTGIARVIAHFAGVPLTITVAVFNCAMFALGYAVLGKRLAFNTLVSTVVFPLLLQLFLNIPALQNITDDALLAALLGGLLIGFGIGIVMRMGGATGGMDIPPLILHKKYKLSVAACIYAFDFAIILAQMLFSDLQQALYGIVAALVSSIVLDKVLVVGAGNVQAFIISREYEKINEIIQTDLDMGSTLVPIETGHLGQAQKAVLCVVSSRDLSRLDNKVLSVDPAAFIIINSAREVNGRGFTMER